MVDVATIVVDNDNSEHGDNCDHIKAFDLTPTGAAWQAGKVEMLSILNSISALFISLCDGDVRNIHLTSQPMYQKIQEFVEQQFLVLCLKSGSILC